MLINQTKNADEAQKIFQTIKTVADKNISHRLNLNLLGWIPSDKVVSRSIKIRTLFSSEAPHSLATYQLKQAANNLLEKLERKVLDTSEDRSFAGFFKRLVEQF
jgi:flagellar biosynthesis protein FlhG